MAEVTKTSRNQRQIRVSSLVSNLLYERHDNVVAYRRWLIDVSVSVSVSEKAKIFSLSVPPVWAKHGTCGLKL